MMAAGRPLPPPDTAPDSVIEDHVSVLFSWMSWLLAAGALVVTVIMLILLIAQPVLVRESPYRLIWLRRETRRRKSKPGADVDWAGLTAPLSAKDREWFVTYVFDPLSDKQTPPPPDDLTTK